MYLLISGQILVKLWSQWSSIFLILSSHIEAEFLSKRSAKGQITRCEMIENQPQLSFPLTEISPRLVHPSLSLRPIYSIHVSSSNVQTVSIATLLGPHSAPLSLSLSTACLPPQLKQPSSLCRNEALAPFIFNRKSIHARQTETRSIFGKRSVSVCRSWLARLALI